MWRTYARRRINESAKLVCDSGSSEVALTTTLQATEIATLPGDAFGHVLCHIDLDLLTESMTAPHMRQPPFRKGQLQRLINSFVTLRKSVGEADQNNQCKLNKGDVIIFRDGGKRAIGDFVGKLLTNGTGRWQRVCKLENLKKLSTQILLSEDGLKERRSRVRGVGALKQLTGLHAFMHAETSIPERSRCVYAGSNLGDVMGPVSFEKWEDSWKLTPDSKKVLYGDNRRAVGGRNPGDDGEEEEDDDEPEVDEQPDDAERPVFQLENKCKVEPVFWWSFPSLYYKEVKHTYYARRIVDMSPGAGNFLIATWDDTPPTPYIGVCFGEDHQKMLMEHLVDEYLKKMSVQNSPTYNRDYVAFLNIGQAQALGIHDCNYSTKHPETTFNFQGLTLAVLFLLL